MPKEVCRPALLAIDKGIDIAHSSLVKDPRSPPHIFIFSSRPPIPPAFRVNSSIRHSSTSTPPSRIGIANRCRRKRIVARQEIWGPIRPGRRIWTTSTSLRERPCAGPGRAPAQSQKYRSATVARARDLRMIGPIQESPLPICKMSRSSWTDANQQVAADHHTSQAGRHRHMRIVDSPRVRHQALRER